MTVQSKDNTLCLLYADILSQNLYYAEKTRCIKQQLKKIKPHKFGSDIFNFLGDNIRKHQLKNQNGAKRFLSVACI